jgi:hypothetical protein
MWFTQAGWAVTSPEGVHGGEMLLGGDGNIAEVMKRILFGVANEERGFKRNRSCLSKIKLIGDRG